MGDSLTLADVLVYNQLAECLSEEQGPGLPKYRREPYGNKAKLDKVLEACPNLRAIIASVSSNENVQKWLAMRGTQAF